MKKENEIQETPDQSEETIQESPEQDEQLTTLAVTPPKKPDTSKDGTPVF